MREEIIIMETNNIVLLLEPSGTYWRVEGKET
jgi:hypothetical protein